MNLKPAGPIDSQVWQAELAPEERVRLITHLQEVADEPFLHDLALQSLSLLNLTPGQAVLDVGCGTGVFLPTLVQAVEPTGRVVGIDYAGALLEEARERMLSEGLSNRVSLIKADASRLPFPNGSFDAAHAERVLMHLEDPETALQEIRRVVRAGGWIVVAEPDYLGFRLDHPDQEAIQLISHHAANAFRNPAIGMELNRRMADAGLVDRRVVVLAEYESTLHPGTLTALTGGAQAAVAVGTISDERADAAISYIRTANERGAYGSYDHMVITAGRVPEA